MMRAIDLENMGACPEELLIIALAQQGGPENTTPQPKKGLPLRPFYRVSLIPRHPVYRVFLPIRQSALRVCG